VPSTAANPEPGTDRGSAVTTPSAGAARTVSGPVLDDGHGSPPGRVPATATTPRTFAGAPMRGTPALPVPATTTTSCSNAWSTARTRSGACAASVVRDRLTTSAPWSTAQVMPAATASVVNRAPSAPTETGRTRAAGATPSTPPGTPRPAISAAIAVPCPPVSRVPSVPSAEPNPAPGSSAPARSGTASSTPESTTATTTPSPRATRCAAGTPNSARCHRCSAVGCPCATPGPVAEVDRNIAEAIAAIPVRSATEIPLWLTSQIFRVSFMFQRRAMWQSEQGVRHNPVNSRTAP